MKKKTSIMLIEDNREFREVMEFSLSDEADMAVTSQYSSAEFALRVLKTEPKVNRPDVILLDLQLTGMSGLEAMQLLQKVAPETKIIILSQSNKEADVLRAISYGASGYLLKSSTVTDVIESIRTVINGGATLDPKVAGFLISKIRSEKMKQETETPITGRELEILSLLAEGFVKKEISDKLGISYRTVDTHVRHIYEKLDVNNGPAAVNIAHRIGLIK